MNLSKRATYLIFLLILLLNIILRYPTVPNEIGWDSFVVHCAANSLSEFGFAKWWLHPTSLIGSYPYSIASSVPFLISGISLLTSLNMNISILLYSTIIGLLCIFVVYILASSIYGNNDNLFNFIVAFGFSTSPAILTFSSWTGPTRTLFAVVLLPFILYLLLKTHQSYKFYILLFCMLALGITTHHYIYFTFVIIIGELLLKVGGKFRKYICINEFHKNVCYIVFFAIAISLPFFTGLFMESERGYSGSRYGFVLMLVSSYFRYSGLLFLFALSGFLYLTVKYEKNYQEWFFLISFALLSPFFYIETYMKWFLQTYIFIFTGIGLSNVFKIDTFKNKKVLPIILILLSVSISGYFQFIHFSDDQDRYLDEKSYASGVWISNRVDGNITGTSQYTALRIYSISEVPTLTLSDMLNYINGFLEYDESKIIKKYSMLSLDYYWHNPYDIDNVDGEWYVNQLPNWNIDDMHFKNFRSTFNISHFICDETDNSDEFSSSLDSSDSTNKIYSNGRISIWNYSQEPNLFN